METTRITLFILLVFFLFFSNQGFKHPCIIQHLKKGLGIYKQIFFAFDDSDKVATLRYTCNLFTIYGKYPGAVDLRKFHITQQPQLGFRLNTDTISCYLLAVNGTDKHSFLRKQFLPTVAAFVLRASRYTESV